jgi:hypothetical protein
LETSENRPKVYKIRNSKRDGEIRVPHKGAKAPRFGDPQKLFRCALGVLGARKFLDVVLSNLRNVRS